MLPEVSLLNSEAIINTYKNLLVLITVVCTNVNEEEKTEACLGVRFDCCVHKGSDAFWDSYTERT